MKRRRLKGKPRCCPNTNCQTPFTKESHEGTLMKGPMFVDTAMRCGGCGWLFLITQDTYMAHDYYKMLPNDPDKAAVAMPVITVVEMDNARKELEKSKAPLKTLFEGSRPERTE